MRRLFNSALHLTEVDSPQNRAFVRLQQTARPHADQLYILGDLCEVWVGDDDDAPLPCALQDALRTASTDLALFFLPGNRDFLLGNDFAAQCGLTLLTDPCRLDDATLITHGDQYCTDDTDYQRMRQMMRSNAWQQEILSRSLDERRALAATLREHSIATKANKPANIMDVNAAAIENALNDHSTRWLIHGHTHRPGVHAHGSGKRFALGAWEHCGWMVEQNGVSEPQLSCFRLADRYET